MPRKASVDRPVPLMLKLPESYRGRLDLELFSPLEGRVPKGKYQEFFMERMRDYFNASRLDLSPFGFEPGFYVFGPKGMIEALKRRLEGGG